MQPLSRPRGCNPAINCDPTAMIASLELPSAYPSVEKVAVDELVDVRFALHRQGSFDYFSVQSAG